MSCRYRRRPRWVRLPPAREGPCRPSTSSVRQPRTAEEGGIPKTPAAARGAAEGGVCTRVYTVTPKKPNSGPSQGRARTADDDIRKSRRTSRGSATTSRALSVVLNAAAVAYDLPGVRYKVIRAALDAVQACPPPAGQQARSTARRGQACRAAPTSSPASPRSIPSTGRSSSPRSSTASWSTARSRPARRSSHRPRQGRRQSAGPRSRCSSRPSGSVTPALEVRSRRVGGANYQVPIEVSTRHPAPSRSAGSSRSPPAPRKRWSTSSSARSSTPATSRAGHSRGRDDIYPDGAGQQGLRALPLVDVQQEALMAVDRNPDLQRRPEAGSARLVRTSGSWPVSTPARPRRPSGSSTTPAARTSSAKSTRRRHHGLDGPGAGAGDHDHLRRHDRVLAGLPDQHHRYARARGLHRRGRALAARPRRRRRRVQARSPACSRSPRPSGARPTSTACRAVAFVDEIDRVGADFFNAMQTMVDRLSANPVAVQVPIGADDGFAGVVDLVRMKTVRYVDSLGMKWEEKTPTGELGELRGGVPAQADRGRRRPRRGDHARVPRGPAGLPRRR